MKVTILGCGASAGVPLIGCDCSVCTSDNPKNNRTRASILIEKDGKRILIDTSPDLRQQSLREGLKTVDAIIYTHAHADHCHGIDDVRSFNYHKGAPIPIYSNQETLLELQTRFPFVFYEPKPEFGWFRACLEPNQLAFENSVCTANIEGIDVVFFLQSHGPHLKTLGVRVGNFSYSTDCNHLDGFALDALTGTHTWIVDCLQDEPSFTHAHKELSLEWIHTLKPQRAILTHLSHTLEFEALSSSLPEGIEAAFDGMTIET